MAVRPSAPTPPLVSSPRCSANDLIGSPDGYDPQADAEDWRALLLLLARSPDDLIAGGGIRHAWTLTGPEPFRDPGNRLRRSAPRARRRRRCRLGIASSPTASKASRARSMPARWPRCSRPCSHPRSLLPKLVAAAAGSGSDPDAHQGRRSRVAALLQLMRTRDRRRADAGRGRSQSRPRDHRGSILRQPRAPT